MPQLVSGAAEGAGAPLVGEVAAEQLQLFDAGVDVSVLRMERAALMARQQSDATRKAYGCDWSDFLAWCAAAGRCPLPASSDSVGLYLVGLARAGRLVSTIERRCSSIAYNHLAAGHKSPVTEDVREVLYGLRRKLGVDPPNRKLALTVDDLRAILKAMPDDVLGVRDRAIMLLGFASGLRRSELSALDLASLRFEAAGVVVHLARSKTDQEGRGRELGVHRGHHVLTCPVRALNAWIRERGAWPGPLFPIVDLHSGKVTRRRLSGEGIHKALRAACTRAGLDARKYGGHSLRAGLATAAAANGASELAIMQRTGHASVAMLTRYVRHGSVFAVDPLAGVL